MSQQYLTEDLGQILRYFPGAEPIALATPFDSSIESPEASMFEEPALDTEWLSGALLWTM